MTSSVCVGSLAPSARYHQEVKGQSCEPIRLVSFHSYWITYDSISFPVNALYAYNPKLQFSKKVHLHKTDLNPTLHVYTVYTVVWVNQWYIIWLSFGKNDKKLQSWLCKLFIFPAIQFWYTIRNDSEWIWKNPIETHNSVSHMSTQRQKNLKPDKI